MRIIVENRLPFTSIHWHSLEIPVSQDGVPGFVQDFIPPGEAFVYEFVLHQHGTFFYHAHVAMQEAMGMVGLFIIHPKDAYEPVVHQDFALITQEFEIRPNATVPDSRGMDFNFLTFNGRCAPMSRTRSGLTRIRSRPPTGSPSGKPSPGDNVGGFVQWQIVTAHKLRLSRDKFAEEANAARWQAMRRNSAC